MDYNRTQYVATALISTQFVYTYRLLLWLCLLDWLFMPKLTCLCFADLMDDVYVFTRVTYNTPIEMLAIARGP